MGNAGSLSMGKGLTILSMVIAAVVVIVFGLDLIVKLPFGRQNLQMMLMDVTFLVGGLLLAYVSWTTFREL